MTDDDMPTQRVQALLKRIQEARLIPHGALLLSLNDEEASLLAAIVTHAIQRRAVPRGVPPDA